MFLAMFCRESDHVLMGQAVRLQVLTHNLSYRTKLQEITYNMDRQKRCQRCVYISERGGRQLQRKRYDPLALLQNWVESRKSLEDFVKGHSSIRVIHQIKTFVKSATPQCVIRPSKESRSAADDILLGIMIAQDFA